MTRFVMCIDNSDYPVDLTLRKVYEVLPPEPLDRPDQLRIVDDSGEDYLYSADRFVDVELTLEAATAFERISA